MPKPSGPKKKAAKPKAAKPKAAPAKHTLAAEAHWTVVYIHGIGNHPPPSVLKCQWDKALFDVNMGDRTRMAYWVNRERYPVPEPGSCAIELDRLDPRVLAFAPTRFAALATDEGNPIERDIRMLGATPKQAEVLRSLAQKIEQRSREAHDARRVQAATVEAKVLPLPGFLRDLVTEGLTRLFLRDVNDFLFDEARRKFMEDRFRERLTPGSPMVVVAHSQGTMIAYDVLRSLPTSDYDVRLLVTLGSPLGLEEVQDQLKSWNKGQTLRAPACVKRWLNVADRLDPVAADNSLADDFLASRLITDVNGIGINPGAPKNPHAATGYLQIEVVRRTVDEVLGKDFRQAVGDFVIARDVVTALEDEDPPDEEGRRVRHEVLIQLKEANRRGKPETLAANRERLVTVILKKTGKTAQDRELALEPLERYVAAKLTRPEVEDIRRECAELQIMRVWRNAKKRALIYRSSQTVQASAAQVGYKATGSGIHWAVLDTGIAASHPHFDTHQNIVAQWDCTAALGPLPANPTPNQTAPDRDGHGTHVAGIIAGVSKDPLLWEEDGESAQVLLAGMAPATKLHIYKVLGDDGGGSDASIIKALDHIAATNDQAGDLVIHGVNLSLGGAVDVEIYNCGYTPLCQELRRLWRQGVLVCVAAGNEGYAVLRTTEGTVDSNMDLSIGDPANLEEAIAVGSTHKSRPHTYGVSYFSSRGPTADGRRKPDVVAPGERIWSALHRPKTRRARKVEDLYIEMGGTSMACPHVSGILAAFLSVRREFIGSPDRVKEILLTNCTDLGRDPYIQGRGMPNLVKMLVTT
jgi:subtilisin family serine protease